MGYSIENGRILALDVGKKRIGLAATDELRMTAQGLDVVGSTPAEMLATMHTDTRKWAELIKSADIKARIDGLGAVTLPGPPEVLDKTIHDEALMWGKFLNNGQTYQPQTAQMFH